MAYNRDMQEDKEPVFDAVLQVRRALAALGARLMGSVRWQEDRMRAAADEGALAAVDLAEWVVLTGNALPPSQHAGRRSRPGGLPVERRVPLAELVQANPDLGEEAGGPSGARGGGRASDEPRWCRPAAGGGPDGELRSTAGGGPCR